MHENVAFYKKFNVVDRGHGSQPKEKNKSIGKKNLQGHCRRYCP